MGTGQAEGVRRGGTENVGEIHGAIRPQSKRIVATQADEQSQR